MKTGKKMRTIGWALGAGLAGAGAALLLAPRSGRVTRRLIRHKAEDFGHGAREAYERVKENGVVHRLVLNLAPRKALGRLVGS